MRKWHLILVTLLSLTVAGCGYNTFQQGDEQVKASWSEVLNTARGGVRGTMPRSAMYSAITAMKLA